MGQEEEPWEQGLLILLFLLCIQHPPPIFMVQIVTILNAPFHWSPCSQFFLIYSILANNPIPWLPALGLWHLVFACDVLSPRCSLCLVHDTSRFLCSSCSGVARCPQHGVPSTVSPAWGVPSTVSPAQCPQHGVSPAQGVPSMVARWQLCNPGTAITSTC